MPRLRVTYLLERADQLWGGVKVVLDDANWLVDRGHDVTVVARSPGPDWMQLRCRFVQVPTFADARLPPSDVCVGTLWSTVPWAALSGAPTVHFCQGYEGDLVDYAAMRPQIEAVYALPGIHHVTVSQHLALGLQARFGIDATVVVQAIDHDVHFPGPVRPPAARIRVGMVGPYQLAGKGIADGFAACALAARAGLELEVVRISNTEPDPRERAQPFPLEFHSRVAPRAMGDVYRSLDVFLGTGRDRGEGFYLPAIEAMACGVPCVLTDLPCTREHGETRYALFVPPGDPVAMAKGLAAAARLEGQRASLRAAGLAAASRYTRRAHGVQLERALAAAAAPAPVPAGAEVA
ncbi:MAG: glycosyltransferase family 4 protein [Planctomycetota bacterium]